MELENIGKRPIKSCKYQAQNETRELDKPERNPTLAIGGLQPGQTKLDLPIAFVWKKEKYFGHFA